MKKLKIFIGLAIIAILIVAIALRTSTLNKKRVLEKTFKVERKTLEKSVSASGKIEAKNQVNLKFQTSGQLVWVGVKEGDRVNAWQAIAQLDKRELEKKLLKDLRDYSKTRWDFEEAQKVTYKDKFITDTIKRILEKNQFDLDKAVTDVEIADIALKLATLVTPISGIVTHIDTPVAGVNITPATAVFTVADPNSLIFKADIDETDIKGIKEGQEATIALDAYPGEEIKGKINKIGFTSVTTSGGGNAFPIEISLPDNSDLSFKIGMNGDVNIAVQEKKGVLSVPISAINKDGSKTYVWLLEGENKVKKAIKIGFETDEDVEILSGLSQNDEVVIETKGK